MRKNNLFDFTGFFFDLQKATTAEGVLVILNTMGEDDAAQLVSGYGPASDVIKIEHTHGGSEGDGEEHWVVFRHTPTGLLFKIDGFYVSYDGPTYDGGWLQVEAKQLTVTVYETVGGDEAAVCPMPSY